MAIILICDDDAACREVLERELSSAGHEVLCAGDGYEALEMVRARTPDLIFLSEDMPVFNGYETCQRMRSEPDFLSIPIVLFAGDDRDPRRSDAAGFTDIFLKQSSSDELRELVARLLGPLANPGA